jgi:hypothetical protein
MLWRLLSYVIGLLVCSFRRETSLNTLSSRIKWGIKLYTWHFMFQRSGSRKPVIATAPRSHSLELNPPRCERTYMYGGASRRFCLETSCWNFRKYALSPCSFNACLCLYLELKLAKWSAEFPRALTYLSTMQIISVPSLLGRIEAWVS